MGNSQSSSQQHHRRFSASPRPRSSNGSSPAPGQPHRSLRQKKKSLELPDLAMLGITPTSLYEQQKSASIPIPASGRQPKEHVFAVQPSDNIERNLGKGQAQQQQGDPNNRGRARQSQVPRTFSTETARPGPIAPPPSRERSPLTTLISSENLPSVIRSSLPLVLPKALEPPVPEVATVPEEPAEAHGVVQELQDAKGRDSSEEMMVKISWHGGGNIVYLARAGDDDWKGRRKMEREAPTSSTFSTIIPLLPGTHHLRFLVDDQWRVADDLPTAVDDQGSLANYVAVGAVITGVITPPEAPSSPSPLGKKPTHRTVNSNAAAGLKLSGVGDPPLGEGLRRYQMGHSFWSASSTVDGEEDIHPSQQPTSPKTPPPSGTPAKPRKPVSRYTPRWTNEIPLELIQAAGEEEAYLSYQMRLQQQMLAQQQYNAYGHSNSRPPVQISGFIPLPNIPPAPALPRYLDKLILNAHMQAKTGVGISVGSTMTNRTASPSGQRGGRERVRSPARDRDREREAANRDRDRDRDREARRRERERRSFGMSAEEAIHGLSRTTDGGSLDDSPTINASTSASGGSTSPTSSTLNVNSKPNSIVFDDTIVADDNSVLPVPSHVVLHHLCTSAIRNGVLAVGETVRYKQKYVTSVYYKPAA